MGLDVLQYTGPRFKELLPKKYLTLARPGDQIDPPKAFDTWHVYMRLNYHHFHRLFLKYCFVHFFQKKKILTAPPGGHGGHF